MIFVIVILITALDQIIKILIINNFPLGLPHPIIENIFNITYVKNTGIAFGMFKGNNLVMIILNIIIITIITVLLYSMDFDNIFFKLSAGFIIGGALGNLIDRINRGFIVDYLDLSFWPTFNLADSMVVIGGIMLAIFLLLKME